MITLKVAPEAVHTHGTDWPHTREEGYLDLDFQVALVSNAMLFRLYMGDPVKVTAWRSRSKDKAGIAPILIRFPGDE